MSCGKMDLYSSVSFKNAGSLNLLFCILMVYVITMFPLVCKFSLFNIDTAVCIIGLFACHKIVSAVNWLSPPVPNWETINNISHCATISWWTLALYLLLTGVLLSVFSSEGTTCCLYADRKYWEKKDLSNQESESYGHQGNKMHPKLYLMLIWNGTKSTSEKNNAMCEEMVKGKNAKNILPYIDNSNSKMTITCQYYCNQLELKCPNPHFWKVESKSGMLVLL